jgi:hypothetical protein
MLGSNWTGQRRGCYTFSRYQVLSGPKERTSSVRLNCSACIVEAVRAVYIDGKEKDTSPRSVSAARFVEHNEAEGSTFLEMKG